MKSFGAKVKEQRGNLGLSQKQLAEKAGMGIRTITSYELGERKPYQAQLYKLAKALEVSTEYLQNDNIEDPSYGLDRMEYVEDMRKHSSFCRRHSKRRSKRCLFSGSCRSIL